MCSRHFFWPLFTLLLFFGSTDFAPAAPDTPSAGVAKSDRPTVTAKKEENVGPGKKVEKPASGSKPSEAPKEVALHEVKSGIFEQKVKLSGTVESTREMPVEMNLKRWTDMTVIKAVPHGTAVKKGEMLIELDSRDLKEKIEEMKLEMPSRELEISSAELELASAEKSTPLALEKASREKIRAEEDLAHFEDQSRPMRDRAAKEEVKEAVESLAYAEEELKQLRKMYEQDDLTEETEEIILRRSEYSVARLRWMLEQTEARSARILDTLLPREHESLKADLELQEIAWRSGEKSMRDALEKKRLETAAKKRQLEDLKKSLLELEEDLVAMKVSAPQDGIVYYGMSQRGKWTTAPVVEKKLIPGGKLAMREIVMTVVDPSKVQVRLQLSEDQLKDLAEGQTGTVKLKWKPDFAFKAKVVSVLHVPYADKTFDGIVSLELSKDGPSLLPGMTAGAEILVYEKNDVIAVPVAAVKKKGDEESVTLKGGKPTRVKTGRVSGDRIEILEGLKAGDVIELGSDRKEGEVSTVEKKPEGEAESEPGKKE